MAVIRSSTAMVVANSCKERNIFICALITLVQGIKQHLDSDTTLYADLPGLRASDNPVSTIPERTLVTSAHPAMVLIRSDEITLIKLTVSHNSLESLSRARRRKSGKEVYLQALGDLEAKGLISHLHTIEFGSLGHWLPTSQRTLLEAVPSLTKKMTRKTMDEAACKVVGASEVIFKAQSEKVWMPSHALL